MYASSYNVLSITETWLSDSVFDSEILPTNFIVYRKTEALVVVPSSILPSPPNLEVICVRLTDIFLCTVYVPPGSDNDYHESLLNYLTKLASSTDHVVIVGDFNLPDINWSSLNGTSTFSNSFCPTHIKGNILDIVLSNTNFIQNASVEPSQLVSSDHFIVSFNNFQRLKKKEVLYVFDYNHADMDSLREFLFDCDFNKCFQSSNIEYVWKFIKGSICHAMDLFIPKVKLRSSKHPRCFNSDIRHHLNCLHSLRRKVKVHPSKLNLMKIKSSEKILQEKMISAKKNI